TTQPATDLGYLLRKNPANVHETKLPFGKAVVFYPEATDQRCEASLIIDVDPVALVRGRKVVKGQASLFDHYVTDRPYAASSFLSVALVRSLRDAMAGKSPDRPELAESVIPLEFVVAPLPARSDELITRLFAPLGFELEIQRDLLDPGFPDWGESPYVTLRLKTEAKLSDALTQLYVLIPALDGSKHYWVGDDEVDKLVAKGGEWLAGHPERDLIAKRYLRRQRYADDALAELDAQFGMASTEAAEEDTEVTEATMRLNDLRYEAVTDAVVKSGARTVCDMGCGEGKLLRRLLQEKSLSKITGVEVSPLELEKAERRLKIDRMSPTQASRIELLRGSVVYDDPRLKGHDALTLVEVIEHIDEERLTAVERVVFAEPQAPTVIVTTPNADYNALYEKLTAGAFRHSDHRFEWTREQFKTWTDGVAERNGYTVTIRGIGEEHSELGCSTQMAIFTREPSDD
ncbi:MAG: 3' terminal RNA ribose 2'-O-methyltransferase Hen1, partial [Pseudomonadota bacterium]